jgi:hypothetical protein
LQRCKRCPQGKKISTLDGNVVANVKTIIVEMNVLHVNFATIIRIIKEQALQEKEPRKSKTIAYMEKEENFF